MELAFRLLILLSILSGVFLFEIAHERNSELVLSGDIFENLNELNESSSKLTLRRVEGAITKHNFANIAHVQSLRLWLCNITSIEYGALCPSSNLTTLSIHSTTLPDGIPPSIFQGCGNLIHLKLTDVNKTVFYNKPFRHLKNLKSLHIRNFDWPLLWRYSLKGLATLENLTISNSDKLQLITHDAFADMVNLEQLEISHNDKLNAFERHPFKSLEKLKILNLNFNNITTLNWKSFHGLMRLQELRLVGKSYHKLDFGKKENVKQMVKVMPNLRKLYLKRKIDVNEKEQRRVSRAFAKKNIQVVWTV